MPLGAVPGCAPVGGVAQQFCATRPVLPGKVVLLEKLRPASLAGAEVYLGLQVCEGAVVSDHAKGGALQEAAPDSKGVDHRQEFALSGGVIDFSLAELARLESDGLAILKEGGAKGIAGGIRDDLKGHGEHRHAQERG